MSKRMDFLKMLSRYGSGIVCSSLDEQGAVTESFTSKAFIQPLRYKNKMYIANSRIPLGEVDGGHYLYVGSPELRLDKQPDTMVIEYDSEMYYIKRAEPYIFQNEPVYIWAILAKQEPNSNGESMNIT